MKRTILGIAIMFLGALMCIAGTTLFSLSARESMQGYSDKSEKPVAVPQENKVYCGTYSYGNSDNITITDSSIIFPDGTKEDYRLSVWKNMPDTDEKTGEITYSDYCFLKTSENSFRYYPLTKEIDIDGRLYKIS